MSHSENKPKTTQTSSTVVTNLNLQDTEGVTLAQSDGNTITVTDHGALATAADIAVEALQTNEDSQRGARELISQAVDDAFSFGSEAFHYGAEIVDRSGERILTAADSTLNFGRDVLSDSSSLIRGVFQDSLDAVTNVLERGQEQVGESLTNINAIAREQSRSDAERVQSIANNALIAAGVIVAIVFISQAFKGGMR
ncbi:hypothetical protein JM946_12630 [Steroidobacter sp. S1-65]|uniref:Methyl-accepting chemotaxis protein n=1 Tax=Steroidobacter gossypii TaxID=2805490 RepID=A0ABS1WXA0_9GAMM|nr:hypothetical protein [Steroidobacter gossypii]MBM0105604.1 hypothetical protein [Steroidobacter gossypii]